MTDGTYLSQYMHLNNLTLEAFERRNADEHREKGLEYRAKEGKERDVFFRMHGVRYSELNRLPYFDPIRMTIIDPMHNILLGTSSITSEQLFLTQPFLTQLQY